MGIVQDWSEHLHSLLAAETLVAADVRIGVFYTAVRLGTGHVGVAFTPRGLSDTVCCPRTAAAAPPAGRLAGRSAWDLAEYASSPVPLRRAVGVATLNALSALAMARFGTPDGELLPGADALDIAGVQPTDRVAMIGAFTPFIKSLKGRVSQLWIVDKHPEALKPDEQPFLRPPEKATDILAQADVAIITGSALVEGGMDELLDAARQARRVVLAGPTASPWPPPFFSRGVHVLGGIQVMNADRMMQIISEGGSPYFFGDAVEKVCIVQKESHRK